MCSCISACVLSVSMCSAGGSACVQLCVGNSAQAFLSLTLIVLCRSSCRGRPGPLQVNFDKGMQFTVLWTLLTKMDTCPWTVNFSWAAMMNPRMHSHALWAQCSTVPQANFDTNSFVAPTALVWHNALQLRSTWVEECLLYLSHTWHGPDVALL